MDAEALRACPQKGRTDLLEYNTCEAIAVHPYSANMSLGELTGTSLQKARAFWDESHQSSALPTPNICRDSTDTLMNADVPAGIGT